MALADVILGLLVDEPAHGYALKQRLSPWLPRERLINDGVLYPLLERLERQRLIASRVRPGQGGPPRRVYRATARGRKAFLTWLAGSQDEEHELSYELFVEHPQVKLLFLGYLPPAEQAAKVQGQIALTEAKLQVVSQIERGLAPANGSAIGRELLRLERNRHRQTVRYLKSLLERISADIDG